MGKHWGVLSRRVIGSDFCLHTILLDAMLGIKRVEGQSSRTSAEAPGIQEQDGSGLGQGGGVTCHITDTFFF